MNVTVLLFCSQQKNICSGSQSKKKKKKPAYLPTLKIRVGERGNKQFFNCSPINILLFYLKKRPKIDSIV